MNKLLVAQSLPYVDVGIEDCAPKKIACNSTHPMHYSIMHDGSLCRMFQFTDMNHLIRDISEIVNNLDNSMIVQIHRLVANESNSVFVTIQSLLDYSILAPKWNTTLTSFFYGPDTINNKINSITFQNLNAMNSSINDSVMPTDIKDNDVCKFLRCSSQEIQANLGIVRVDDDKYFSSFSLNNTGSIPMVKNVLSANEYLQVISFIRSGKDREKTMKRDFIDKSVLISALSGVKRKQREVQVHTIVSSDQLITTLQSGLLYCNVKYVFTAPSIDALNRINTTVSYELSQNQIVPYHHTVSGKNEFIAAFPGNAIYGDQFHIINQEIAGLLTDRVLAI